MSFLAIQNGLRRYCSFDIVIGGRIQHALVVKGHSSPAGEVNYLGQVSIHVSHQPSYSSSKTMHRSM